MGSRYAYCAPGIEGIRWGIWYTGSQYGGPRWCFDRRTRRGFVRLERDSREAAEAAMEGIRAWNKAEATFYEVHPIFDPGDLSDDRVLH